MSALPRLTGPGPVIKPNVASSANSKTAVGPKKRGKSLRPQAAAVVDRPLLVEDVLSGQTVSGPPSAPVTVPVSAVGPSAQEDVLDVWKGPRSRARLGAAEGAGSPAPQGSSAASPAGTPRAPVLHIGDIPLAAAPAAKRRSSSAGSEVVAPAAEEQETERAAPVAEAIAAPAAAPAVPAAAHVVAAAAVAAAAGQHAGPDAYMAGVAAGVAAMVAQQQQHAAAAAAAAAAARQQAPAPAAAPPAPHFYPPQQFWDATTAAAAAAHHQQQQAQAQQQQHLAPAPFYPPHPQAPQPQQQHGTVYYPPPPQYFAHMPYAYPHPHAPGMGAPQYGPYPPAGPYAAAPYGAEYGPTYPPLPQQHPVAAWAEDATACGSSAASEASYPLTHYPATPVPSTPTASSIAGSSALPRSHRGERGDVVTVSAASSVKDAAGAVAKVLERQGSCLLVALRRAGDTACGATHVAAKTLAVSRFYVNARMGAAGAAGGAAARALVAAAEGRKVTSAEALPAAEAEVTDAAAAPAAAVAGKEEVTFVPFQRSARPHEADSLGFVVFKVKADDLPVPLPPPVGQPSSLPAPRGDSSSAAAEAASQEPPLLKAGAGTDVNKLSNAVIRNVLEFGRVSLQLAGPAACHVAMAALAKARSRLARKFETSIAVASAFSTEDTSGALGRATVFYRLDVLRVGGAAAEAAAAGWTAAGLLASEADATDGASSVGTW